MARISIGLAAWLVLAPALLAQPKSDSLPAGALARLGEVRYRSVGRVFTVAFSPDGKTLAAGAWDGSIRLWDVTTRQEIRQFVGHSGWVRSVVFLPDGKTLASGGKDKIIRLWDTATGKELRQLKGHENWVQHLTLTADGKTLASQSTDLTLRLWDVATGRELKRIDIRPFIGNTLSFSPDGKLLAYVGKDPHTILLLDFAKNAEVRKIPYPGSWFQHVAFSPDGKTLVGVRSSNDAPAILSFDTATGKEQKAPGKEEVDVSGIAFSWDSRSLASVEHRRIRIWEMSTHQQRIEFDSPDRKISALAFSPDGRLLAQGSDDATVLLWDVTGRMDKGRLRPASLSPKELQGLGVDLDGADAAAAHRAMWTLTAAAPQSLPFLQERMRPPPPLSPTEERTVTQLIADLDSEQFARRQQATEQLEKLVERAEPIMRQTLEQKPPLETRQRLERLLEKVTMDWATPSTACLRILRTLEVVEHMNTPDARRFLEQLANDKPDVELTRQAKAALRRLSKR